MAVNGTIGTYVVCALIFTFLAGGIFFSGGNFLLCVFVITLAGTHVRHGSLRLALALL